MVALDLSLFFILSDDGLRISELPTLTIGDWDLQAQTLHIRHGKGGTNVGCLSLPAQRKLLRCIWLAGVPSAKPPS